MTKIFISHSSKDKPFARKLKRYLENAGYDTWMDESDIKTGENFVKEIIDGLESSHLMILLLSPNSMASEWVEKEWTAMINRGVKENCNRIIPVMIEYCKRPPLLSELQYLKFLNNHEYNINRKELISIIANLMTELAEKAEEEDLPFYPIDFTLYINHLANLSLTDLVSFQKTKDHYIPLGGIDFSKSKKGKKVSYVEFLSKKHTQNQLDHMHWSQHKNFEQIDSLEAYIFEWMERDKTSPLLISASAGTGKSTLTKYISYSLARKWLEDKNMPIPLYIPLKRAIPKEAGSERGDLIKDTISTYFSTHFESIDFKWTKFIGMLADNQIAIIFDGFDELTRRSDYQILEDFIIDICDLFPPWTKLILTTRPEAFISLSDIPEIIPLVTTDCEIEDSFRFQPIGIQPLNTEKIVRYIQSFGIDESFLLETLTDSDLMSRPLLLSMIVTIIDELKSVKTISECELYHIYASTWLKREKNKERKIRLPQDINLDILIIKMAWCDINKSVQLNRDEVIRLIKEYSAEVDIELDNNLIKLIADILSNCTFLEHFTPEGIYKFNHKSFAEYYIAEGFNSYSREIICNVEELYSLDHSSIRNILKFASDTFLTHILDTNPTDETISYWFFAYISHNEDQSYRMNEEIKSVLTKNDLIKRRNGKEWLSYTQYVNPLTTMPTRLNFKSFLVFKDISYINLMYNRLKKIDFSPLSSLPNLQNLRLGGNRLTEASIGSLISLSNLEELDLTGNQLTDESVASVSSLKNLKVLDLSINRLTKTSITSLSSLTNLEELILNRCDLSNETIALLSHLKKLKELSFRSNNLKDVDFTSLATLEKLQSINLMENQLSANAIASLASLKNLKDIHLGENNLVNIDFSCLSSLNHLQTLYLIYNPLSDASIASLQALKNLKELIFRDQNFSREAYISLSTLKNLKELRMNSCGISSDGVDSISLLKNLESLSLSSNKLDKSTISSLSSLKSLKKLVMTSCSLTDTLIASLPDLPNLRTIDLSSNNLEYINFDSVRGFKTIENLNLFRNRLKKESIDSLLTLTNLQIIHLDADIMSDEDIIKLTSLSSLKRIYLYKAKRLSERISMIMTEIRVKHEQQWIIL